MIQTANNNLSVLPWYTSLEEQNHRKSYAFGNVYPLISPSDKLLPFQIIRPTRSNNLSHCKIYDINGKEVADITAAILETGFYIKKFTDFDILINVGLLPLGIRLLEGRYYAEISDGIQTWYSEVFTVISDLSKCIRLEWWDEDDLKFDAGAIAYTAPKFKNILYIQSELGKPEYSFEEEGETRDGYFFPELQISEKTYKFTFIAPEYLCDVLRLVRLSDHKIITDKYGHTYDCDTLSFEVEWQEQGDLAVINAEFQTATVVKKIGRGIIDISKGDFNKSYNVDFYRGDNIVKITITFTYDTGNTNAYLHAICDAEKPVKSDIVIEVKVERYFEFSGQEVSTETINMKAKESQVDYKMEEWYGDYSKTKILEAKVVSQGEDDATEYVLSVVNTGK